MNELSDLILQDEIEEDDPLSTELSGSSFTPFDTAKIDIIVKPMTISKLLDRLQNDE
jgi:hypothetical protein